MATDCNLSWGSGIIIPPFPPASLPANTHFRKLVPVTRGNRVTRVGNAHMGGHRGESSGKRSWIVGIAQWMSRG